MNFILDGLAQQDYYHIVLLAEGPSPETRQRRSGMRRLRVELVTQHSGGVGAPPGWPLRATCEELADDRYSRRKRGPTPNKRRSGAPEGEHPDRKGCAAERRKLVRLSALRSPRFEGKNLQRLGRKRAARE